MENFILYTIASVFTMSLFSMLAAEWITYSDHRTLSRLLRDGREYEATILNVTCITPTFFNLANMRITAEVTFPGEKPSVIQFKYEASYPEWQQLYTGRKINLDIDPANPKNVLLNNSRFAHQRRHSNNPEIAAITE